MKKIKLFYLVAIAAGAFLTSCKEAPTAKFEVQDGTLYTTKDIEFTDLSDGGGIDCSWTFEGAVEGTSSSSSPTAVWNTPGTYDVTLVASNKKGEDKVIQQVTIEQYIPYITIENNTPGSIWVTVGVEGLQSGESELLWALLDADHNKGFAIIEAYSTIDVKLWDDGDPIVDFAGKDQLYIAIFSGNYLYSKDAEDGKQPLAWHNEGLSKMDMDSKAVIDVSEDYFYATVKNSGYSKLDKFIAFMGEDINDNVVGTCDTKSVNVDETKEIGYFDAYQGVKFGTFYTNSSYVYWQNFESNFGTNCSITFENTDYKSANKFIATSGASIVKDGDVLLNTPRAASVSTNDKELFEAKR